MFEFCRNLAETSALVRESFYLANFGCRPLKTERETRTQPFARNKDNDESSREVLRELPIATCSRSSSTLSRRLNRDEGRALASEKSPTPCLNRAERTFVHVYVVVVVSVVSSLSPLRLSAARRFINVVTSCRRYCRGVSVTAEADTAFLIKRLRPRAAAKVACIVSGSKGAVGECWYRSRC